MAQELKSSEKQTEPRESGLVSLDHRRQPPRIDSRESWTIGSLLRINSESEERFVLGTVIGIEESDGALKIDTGNECIRRHRDSLDLKALNKAEMTLTEWHQSQMTVGSRVMANVTSPMHRYGTGWACATIAAISYDEVNEYIHVTKDSDSIGGSQSSFVFKQVGSVLSGSSSDESSIPSSSSTTFKVSRYDRDEIRWMSAHMERKMKAWKIRTPVSVYSNSDSKWTLGIVVEILLNELGEMEVKIDCGKYFKRKEICSDEIKQVNLDQLSPDDRCRIEWAIGSQVNVFSKAQQKWFIGQITEIKLDQNKGEFLAVEFAGGCKRWFSRFDPESIRGIIQRNHSSSSSSSASSSSGSSSSSSSSSSTTNNENESNSANGTRNSLNYSGKSRTNTSVTSSLPNGIESSSRHVSFRTAKIGPNGTEIIESKMDSLEVEKVEPFLRDGLSRMLDSKKKGRKRKAINIHFLTVKHGQGVTQYWTRSVSLYMPIELARLCGKFSKSHLLAKRKDWKKGSILQVFSNGHGKWRLGTVIDVERIQVLSEENMKESDDFEEPSYVDKLKIDSGKTGRYKHRNNFAELRELDPALLTNDEVARVCWQKGSPVLIATSIFGSRWEIGHVSGISYTDTSEHLHVATGPAPPSKVIQKNEKNENTGDSKEEEDDDDHGGSPRFFDDDRRKNIAYHRKNSSILSGFEMINPVIIDGSDNIIGTAAHIRKKVRRSRHISNSNEIDPSSITIHQSRKRVSRYAEDEIRPIHPKLVHEYPIGRAVEVFSTSQNEWKIGIVIGIMLIENAIALRIDHGRGISKKDIYSDELKQIDESKLTHDQRERISWTKGSKVAVYSKAQSKWFHDGFVVQIKMDESKGELLRVIFAGGDCKKYFGRFDSKSIMPVGFNDDEMNEKKNDKGDDSGEQKTQSNETGLSGSVNHESTANVGGGKTGKTEIPRKTSLENPPPNGSKKGGGDESSDGPIKLIPPFQIPIENGLREQWRIGSSLLIFSKSKQKWSKGQIIRITSDFEGETLHVRYDDSFVKRIDRYSDYLKVVPSEILIESPQETGPSRLSSAPAAQESPLRMTASVPSSSKGRMLPTHLCPPSSHYSQCLSTTTTAMTTTSTTEGTHFNSSMARHHHHHHHHHPPGQTIASHDNLFCQNAFEDWLLNDVGLPAKYLQIFVNMNVNDLRYIVHLNSPKNDPFIKKSILSANLIHLQRFVSCVDRFKDNFDEFESFLKEHGFFSYLSMFERKGIMSLRSLKSILMNHQKGIQSDQMNDLIDKMGIDSIYRIMNLFGMTVPIDPSEKIKSKTSTGTATKTTTMADSDHIGTNGAPIRFNDYSENLFN